MTKHHAWERDVERTLMGHAEGAIPSETDLWPLVRQRLDARALALKGVERTGRPGRLRGIVAIAACVCAASAAGGITAAAASPRIRGALTHAVAAAAGAIGFPASISADTNSRRIDITPAPPFRYAELDAIPAPLTLHAFGYIPANRSGARPTRGLFIVTANPGHETKHPITKAVRLGSHTPTPPNPPEGQGVDAYLAPEDPPQSGPVVWLSFTAPAPGTGYVVIAEQPAPPRFALPAGKPLTVAGVSAVVEQAGGGATVTLARFGTVVHIRTNLGRNVAVQAARALVWH